MQAGRKPSRFEFPPKSECLAWTPPALEKGIKNLIPACIRFQCKMPACMFAGMASAPANPSEGQRCAAHILGRVLGPIFITDCVQDKATCPLMGLPCTQYPPSWSKVNFVNLFHKNRSIFLMIWVDVRLSHTTAMRWIRVNILGPLTVRPLQKILESTFGPRPGAANRKAPIASASM